MALARTRLIESLCRELTVPISSEASALVGAIRARHGEAVAAIAFYGSCLRRGTADGLHDFYVVVDDYRATYRSRALAAANALFPPNVFYLELREGECKPSGAKRGGAERRSDGSVTLRAKYAVVSRADLARGCRGETRRTGTWARFAQPIAAAYQRNPAARDVLLSACADAVCTAVRAGLAARGGDWQTVEAPTLWRDVFRATYAAELRPEREGASDAIYADQPDRFDARLGESLAVMLEGGAIECAQGGPPMRVRLRSPLARAPRQSTVKLLAALQLVKSAATFGDWLPYALWKLERHSGVRLEPSERQRRHPWLFAWPLVFRALRRGALR